MFLWGLFYAVNKGIWIWKNKWIDKSFKSQGSIYDKIERLNVREGITVNRNRKLSENSYIKIATVAIVAFIGGYSFHRLGIYLPWMLGPLFFILLLKMKFGRYFYWPRKARSAGLIILGVQLGSEFTKTALAEMVRLLPYMLLSTITVTLFTVVTGVLMAKKMKLSVGTALLGSFPGGLSQMVILSEELKNVNETVVAFMQTLRVILVISIVPWIVTHVMSNDVEMVKQNMKAHFFLFQYDWKFALLLAMLVMICIILFMKIHFPLPYLLGPLVAATLFNLIGPGAPEIPSFWLNLSQLLIGAHLGYTLKVNNLQLFKKMFGAIFISNVLLIVFCYGITTYFIKFVSIPINELFLSLAPGGVAEMSVTALSIHADVSVVASFHLFRILFILFVASPVMKWILLRKKSE